MKARYAAMAAALAIVAGGAAVAVIAEYAGSKSDPEGWYEAIALAGPYIAGGLLATFASWRGHPGVQIGAGVALCLLSLVSIATILLFIPAAALVAFGASRGSTLRGSELLAAMLVVVGLPVALIVLIVHPDPASWSTPQGSASTTDIVTKVEATLSLSVSLSVSIAALALMLLEESRSFQDERAPGVEKGPP